MSDSPPQDESTWISAAKRGDAEAFGRLVTTYQPRVYMTAHRMLQNHDDALDVVQDAFLRAWRKLPEFDPKAAFGAWITRIAANASIDVIRRRQTRAPSPLPDGPLHADAGSQTTPGAAPTPGDTLDESWIRERYQSALATLSDDHRAVLVLKEFDDLSYREIADTLGCSVGTVMSRLFYARQKMQTALKDVYEAL